MSALDGVARESKVGQVSDSKHIQKQLQKDEYILSHPEIYPDVNKIEWHLFDSPINGKGGLTTPLQNRTNQMMNTYPNFEVIYHGKL